MQQVTPMQHGSLDAQKILFISDVHLGAFSPAKEQQIENDLLSLIDYARTNGFKIAILGDLFDYWVEYPHHIPALGERLLQHFKQLHQATGPSLYITGNHDYWTLGHFARLGFDVEPDCRVWCIQAGKALLLHGDAIGKDLHHLKRPLFHRMLRNAFFLKLYRALLPANTGLWLMKKVSQWSKARGKNYSPKQMLDRWAKKMLHDTDIDFILCGHDHCPRIRKYTFGTYINLGTFHHHRTLAIYNNNQFGLVYWNSTTQELTPFEPQKTVNE